MKRVLFLLAMVALVTAAVQPAAAQGKIALLNSANTREFFQAHYRGCGYVDQDGSISYYLGGDEYQRYFRGWQWVLGPENEGTTYDLVDDEDLTAAGLAKYRLLILSNNALLTKDQTNAVHQWVLRGGRLLATFGSGYKDFASDPRQIDGWKEQKGGTFGLHELWHDPVGKLFSTFWLEPVDASKGVSVDVKITRYEGPTAGLAGLHLPDNFLGYGAEANLLIRRPVNHPNVLGFLDIGNADVKAPTPAIISTRQGKGLVVYLAFAPEYIVYKELEMPGNPLGVLPSGWPACDDHQNWAHRSDQLRVLMTGALEYLTSGQ